MRHGYVYELEQEVVRLTRRRQWPLWIFAFVFGGLASIAWLEHAYPRVDDAGFVRGAR